MAAIGTSAGYLKHSTTYAVRAAAIGGAAVLCAATIEMAVFGAPPQASTVRHRPCAVTTQPRLARLPRDDGTIPLSVPITRCPTSLTDPRS